tara:strand:- start:179 stop:1033 length:855 start_codon:yes stop_codon:yes gene_type:complete
LVICFWSPTWYVIKFQLGTVDPVLSVAYRFFIAALILFFFTIITKRKISFKLQDHFWFFLLGINLFSLNYILFYIANLYLISGIVAVCFSALIFMNILNERIFFQIKATYKTYLASMIGLLGLFIIFNKEIIGFTYSNKVHYGILLGIIATYFASLGNIISLRNSKNNLPIISTLSYAMLYGSIFTFIVSVILNKEIIFDISFSYITSLLFLSFVGSVLAFTLYLKLIEQIGAGRAGYIGAIIPVVALIISTYFENLAWNQSIIFGLFLLILGAVLVIHQKQQR